MEKTTWLKITPDGLESHHLTFESAFELLLSALRQYALALIERDPDNTPLRRELYDWINQGVSGILHEIDPSADPNPDLDINEVIARQDLYIRENLENLKQNNPRRYKRALKEVRQKQSDMRARILEKNLRTRQISIEELNKQPFGELLEDNGSDPS